MAQPGDLFKEEEEMSVKAQYIPEEIVINILPNLRIDSLLRFRCVSKQWCYLISQTQTHRRKYITKSGSDGTYRPFYKESNGSVSIHSIDQTTGSVEDVRDMPWEANIIQIYGSCNGLLLIGVRDDLFLWNPLLGLHEKLFSYYRLSHAGPEEYTVVGGLCFDSVNNEYKIVMALSHDSPDYGGEFVAVGSPRNKTWTHIRFPYNVGKVRSGPVFNNRLHWIVNVFSSRRFCACSRVVYFDTQIDEFVELPMPVPKEVDGDSIGGLGVLDGCLCMTRAKSYGGDTVEVLAMKEYGLQESWSVLLIIIGVCLSGGVVPLFYICETKNEVLVKVTEGERDIIILYDRNANSRIEVTSVEYFMHCTDTGIVYEETIAIPTGYGWADLDSRGEASYLEVNWCPDYYGRTWKRNEQRRSWTCVKSEYGSKNKEDSERREKDSETHSKLHQEYCFGSEEEKEWWEELEASFGTWKMKKKGKGRERKRK